MLSTSASRTPRSQTRATLQAVSPPTAAVQAQFDDAKRKKISGTKHYKQMVTWVSSYTDEQNADQAASDTVAPEHLNSLEAKHLEAVQSQFLEAPASVSSEMVLGPGISRFSLL